MSAERERGLKGRRGRLWLLVVVICGGLSASAWAADSEPQVIALTQTACQFVEAEARDHNFHTTSAADCKAINGKTGTQRLAQAKTLELKPGDYIFRVSNKNVPYELGFYLRGTGLGRLTLPKVSGGGLVTGKTQDYRITLREGEYVYSCPLNPTPDYRLVVKR
jgi:hypothetical protein